MTILNWIRTKLFGKAQHEHSVAVTQSLAPPERRAAWRLRAEYKKPNHPREVARRLKQLERKKHD